MAKIHILDQNTKKDTAQVIYHIDIPDVANSGGMSYRAALVEHLNPDGTGIVSRVPNLETSNPTEFANLQSGAVYEASERVEFDANLTAGQKATEIDNHYNARKDSILSAIQDRLKYWGTTRNPA